MTNQELVASIKRAFSNLTRFSGRDSRSQFWPFAIGLFLVQNFIAFVGIVPVFFSTFGNIKEFAAQHPDQAVVTSGPGYRNVAVEGYHPELMPDMTPFIWFCGLSGLVMVALLAAAVARRLHDTGRSGIWGILPLPFLGFGMFSFYRIFSSFSITGNDEKIDEELASFILLMFANNVIYLILLLILVVFLVLPGQRDDNRFGPPPAG